MGYPLGLKVSKLRKRQIRAGGPVAGGRPVACAKATGVDRVGAKDGLACPCKGAIASGAHKARAVCPQAQSHPCAAPRSSCPVPLSTTVVTGPSPVHSTSSNVPPAVRIGMTAAGSSDISTKGRQSSQPRKCVRCVARRIMRQGVSAPPTKAQVGIMSGRPLCGFVTGGPRKLPNLATIPVYPACKAKGSFVGKDNVKRISWQFHRHCGCGRGHA